MATLTKKYTITFTLSDNTTMSCDVDIPIAGVVTSVNGSTNATGIYAPTSSGTNGQFLKSNGSNVSPSGVHREGQVYTLECTSNSAGEWGGDLTIAYPTSRTSLETEVVQVLNHSAICGGKIGDGHPGAGRGSVNSANVINIYLSGISADSLLYVNKGCIGTEQYYKEGYIKLGTFLSNTKIVYSERLII